MNKYRVGTLQQRYNAPTRSVSSFPDSERITTGSLKAVRCANLFRLYYPEAPALESYFPCVPFRES
jgi:hypothetical protein